MTDSALNRTRLSRSASARIAGAALLAMAAAAAFSYGMVYGTFVVPDDAHATFGNLTSSSLLFDAGILGWIAIIAADLVVAWGFYRVLKPVDRRLSLLGACLRLVYTVILGVAVTHLAIASLFAKRAGNPAADGRLAMETMTHVEAFDRIWSIGLIVFGVHLLIVGYLAWKWKRAPAVLGILLWIAAAGYIAVHAGNTFFPLYGEAIRVIESALQVPMAVGELGFGIWLLVKAKTFSAEE